MFVLPFFFQRRRARLRHLDGFDIDTFDLPFGVHLPPYAEEDSSENSPPTYNQIYPQPQPTESSSAENHNYENREYVRTSAMNPRGSVYSILPLQDNGGLCYENCPYCSSATQNSASYSSATQNSANYSYVNYAVNPTNTEQSVSLHNPVVPNNSHSRTIVCPALVHNDGRSLDDSGYEETTNTDNTITPHLHQSIRPRRFWNRGRCYEVTVNLEWI